MQNLDLRRYCPRAIIYEQRQEPMEQYCKELERLIIDVLLPVYVEHARLLGRKDALKEINQDLIMAMKKRRQLPILLQRQKYG